MARIFENPSNKHRETVGTGAAVGVFFLGLLYLLFKGLWAHALVWFVVVALFPAFTDPVLAVFTVPLASIFYALAIQQILASRYLRLGWKEVTPGAVAPMDELSAVTDRLVATPDPMLPRTPLASQANDSGPMKTCPYCAELVKAAAIKCKHCQSDLSAAA